MIAYLKTAYNMRKFSTTFLLIKNYILSVNYTPLHNQFPLLH